MPLRCDCYRANFDSANVNADKENIEWQSIFLYIRLHSLRSRTMNESHIADSSPRHRINSFPTQYSKIICCVTCEQITAFSSFSNLINILRRNRIWLINCIFPYSLSEQSGDEDDSDNHKLHAHHGFDEHFSILSNFAGHWRSADDSRAILCVRQILQWQRRSHQRRPSTQINQRKIPVARCKYDIFTFPNRCARFN